MIKMPKQPPNLLDLYERIGSLNEELHQKDEVIKQQDQFIEQLNFKLEALMAEYRNLLGETIWEQYKQDIAKDITNDYVKELFDFTNKGTN